jgi:ATP-binding cassette subfamily B protein
MKNNLSKVYEKMKTISWSFKLAWKIDKRILVIWMSLSIVLSVLPAISLYFNREIIDRLSVFITGGSGTYDEIIPQIIFLGIILTFIGLSSRVNSDLIYMIMYDSYYIGMEETLMDGLQRIEITDLLKSEINDEYNYIVGRAGSLTDLMSGSCTITGKIISIVSLLFVAVSTSLTVFVITTVYVIAVLILNFSFTEKVRWNTNDYRSVERVSSYYENLPFNSGAAKEIRIFKNSEFVLDQWRKAFAKVKKYENNYNFAIEIRNLISGVGFYLFLIVMMVYSLTELINGEMEVSTFLVLFTLCLSIFTAISGLARNIMSFDYGLYALDRQRKFFEIAPFKDNSTKKFNSSIKKVENIPVFLLQDVSFAYREGVPVLKNINLRINKGEVIAIVGENGSGKTTLTKLLLGMFKPTAGNMEFLGNSYEKYLPDEIRASIGVFFQDFYLFHAPLSENIAYGDIANLNDEDKIYDAIQKSGADKVIRKLPKGIHTLLGKQVYKDGVELSGGEKQRIGVARAHMSNRDILIFDEPAAALDPIAEMDQFLNIRERLKGRTAILISHRVGFARMADKVLMMENGCIIEEGHHEELMAHNGAYARFFKEQAQWYEQTVDTPINKAENTND